MTNLEKHLLMSIRPEHAANILNGKKTLEIRKVIPKWALEELRKGNQVKCLMYVTKAKQRFRIGHLDFFNDDLYRLPTGEIKYGCSVELMVYGHTKDNFLNGTIPFMVTFDDVIDLTYALGWGGGLHPEFDEEDIAKKACLTVGKLLDYTQAEKGLALHISSVRIFDKPMQLSDCLHFGKISSVTFLGKTIEHPKGVSLSPITRAPQNCMTVYAEV